MSLSKLVVAYWDLQAVAHPIRLLLAYHYVDFEDKIYYLASSDEWFRKDKPALNTPFPNLPYIKDGDFVLTESAAVIQYAALKTGNPDLLGKSRLDEFRITQFSEVLKDQLTNLFDSTIIKDFESVKDRYYGEKIAPFSQKLSNALGDKHYCMGYLTYVDFQLAYQSDLFLRIHPNFMKKYTNLIDHRDRIWNNEGIQAYRITKNYPSKFIPGSNIGEELL